MSPLDRYFVYSSIDAGVAAVTVHLSAEYDSTAPGGQKAAEKALRKMVYTGVARGLDEVMCHLLNDNVGLAKDRIEEILEEMQ